MAGTAEGARRAREYRARLRAEAAAAAARGQRSPELVAAGMRVLITGVDTLELHTTMPLRSSELARLERLKEMAAATLPGRPLPRWEAAGLSFEVSRGGSKRGAFLLQCDEMAISLNPHAPKGLPTGIVEVRSRHLWQGLDNAAGDAEEALGVLTSGEHPDVQVSRVDVTADFQGWIPSEADFPRFVCRARSDAAYRKNRRASGWAWGSGGANHARLYDKTLEIRGTDKADWFPELWAGSAGYDAAAAVWRAEFQLRRDSVRELDDPQLTEGAFKSWAGMRPHLGSIFRTMSDRWLSLRLPRTARERQRVDPRWERLRDAAEDLFVEAGSEPGRDLRRVQLETEFSRTTEQLAAYAARGIAESWALYGEKGITESFDALLFEIAKVFEAKGTSLEGRVWSLYAPLQEKVKLAAARKAQRAREAREALRVREQIDDARLRDALAAARGVTEAVH